jgi:hypothetical protein
MPFAFGVRWQGKRHTALAGAGTALPERPARAKPRLAGTPRSAGAPVSHSCAMVIAQLRRKDKCSIGSIGCIGSFPVSGVFFGAASRPGRPEAGFAAPRPLAGDPLSTPRVGEGRTGPRRGAVPAGLGGVPPGGPQERAGEARNRDAPSKGEGAPDQSHGRAPALGQVQERRRPLAHCDETSRSCPTSPGELGPMNQDEPG